MAHTDKMLQNHPKMLREAGTGKEILEMSRLLSENTSKECHGLYDVA